MINDGNLVFGIRFFEGSKQHLLSLLQAKVKEPYSYIVTPNVNHVVRLDSDQRLRLAYSAASFRLCDSKVLYPILRYFGVTIEDVIPGSSLTETLLGIAELKSWKVTVLGGNDADIEAVKSRFRNVKFYHFNPPMGFIEKADEVRRCVEFVKGREAELILYCVGCPQQEIVAYEVYKDSGGLNGVGVCVGASLDFISGRKQRAPVWIQKIGMEWAHRICCEPRRLFKRYALDAIKFFPILLKEKRRQSSV